MSVHVCRCEESRPGFATAAGPKGGQQNGSNGPSRWDEENLGVTGVTWDDSLTFATGSKNYWC